MSLTLLHWDEAPIELREAWLHLAQSRLSGFHLNRQKEWALARVCLALCFKEHGIELKPNTAIFKNFHELAHLPHWRFSLSHTKDYAAAWLEPAASLRGMGLDIELTSRKVPEHVKSKIHHEADISVSLLELWSIKEAAYKALPELAQTDIWLNHFRIGSGDYELINSPFSGSWQQEKRGNILISKAKLPK